MAKIEISLSEREIKALLFPYKPEDVYLVNATYKIEGGQCPSLSAVCNLPLPKPVYLNKEINYITATEGLALVTRAFILMYTVSLQRELLKDFVSQDPDICKDPEAFTLNILMNCRRRILGNENGVKKNVKVKVWLHDGWTVEIRRGKKAFKGRIGFELGENDWDGWVDTFIWLER